MWDVDVGCAASGLFVVRELLFASHPSSRLRTVGTIAAGGAWPMGHVHIKEATSQRSLASAWLNPARDRAKAPWCRTVMHL